MNLYNMAIAKKDLVTYSIDAKGKKLGRVASQAASLLMGKNRADFARHISPNVKVEITNASKLSLTDAKKKETKYMKYSGYQGGLRIENLEMLAERRGYSEGLKRAIKGMMPDNKLRPELLKRLTITD